MRQGASYISAAKPQKCYCMGSMNVVLANVALASAGFLEASSPVSALIANVHVRYVLLIE